MAIGANALGFVALKGLHLSDAQKNRNARGLARFLQSLADFKAAVAGHINVKHDQVRPALVNLLERGRSVINGNDLIASIHKNAASHVLGGHTIVSKQYGTCQGVPR